MPDTPRLNNANLWDDPAFAGVNRGSPTMPDTPEIAAIRARHLPDPIGFCENDEQVWPCETDAILAHLDALTAAGLGAAQSILELVNDGWSSLSEKRAMQARDELLAALGREPHDA